MKDGTQIPHRSSDFTVRDIGDETIFISEKGDTLHTLNEVGSFIWRQIDGKISVQDITDLLATDYDVPSETATADVQGFLYELAEKGLVHYS